MSEREIVNISVYLLCNFLNQQTTGRKEGRKEMFYLTTHSTLYLRLCGVRYMVKDHSNSERKPAAATAARVLLYAPSHTLLYQSWNTDWNENS